MRETERQRNRETEGQRDRGTERQRAREPETQRDKVTNIPLCTPVNSYLIIGCNFGNTNVFQ